MRVVLATTMLFISSIDAFIVSQHEFLARKSTAVFGAFNKRNKQAELMKRFEENNRMRSHHQLYMEMVKRFEDINRRRSHHRQRQLYMEMINRYKDNYRWRSHPTQ